MRVNNLQAFLEQCAAGTDSAQLDRELATQILEAYGKLPEPSPVGVAPNTSICRHCGRLNVHRKGELP